MNDSIIVNLKQASFCKLFGCFIEFEDVGLGRFVFHVTPADYAEKLIILYENGEPVSAKGILNIHGEIHQTIQKLKKGDKS